MPERNVRDVGGKRMAMQVASFVQTAFSIYSAYLQKILIYRVSQKSRYTVVPIFLIL